MVLFILSVAISKISGMAVFPFPFLTDIFYNRPAVNSRGLWPAVDQSANIFTFHRLFEPVQGEAEDGQLLLPAEGDGGQVRGLQVVLDDLLIGKMAVADGVGVLLGVGGIDGVHVLGEEQGVRADLRRPEGRRRVRGEEGAAGAAGEDDDNFLAQELLGLAAGEAVAEPVHVHGGQDGGLLPQALEGVLERQGVDGGGQHTHVVPPVAVVLAGVPTPDDVAAAYDHAHLDALLGQGRDAPGGLLHLLKADGAVVAHQRLAADLQQDPLVHILILPHCIFHSIPRPREKGKALSKKKEPPGGPYAASILPRVHASAIPASSIWRTIRSTDLVAVCSSTSYSSRSRATMAGTSMPFSTLSQMSLPVSLR